MADRAPPELLDAHEQRELLTMAENLWCDLQANNIGGFSDGNRPFYIVHEFKRVIEKFSARDVGLNWTYNQLMEIGLKP